MGAGASGLRPAHPRRGLETRKGPAGHSRALPGAAARPCTVVAARTGEIHEALGREGSPAGGVAPETGREPM